MSVKVELLGADVAFVPALDSQMSDKSIPEIVKRWLTTLLETCGKVRLDRGAQQVCYWLSCTYVRMYMQYNATSSIHYHTYIIMHTGPSEGIPQHPSN